MAVFADNPASLNDLGEDMLTNVLLYGQKPDEYGNWVSSLLGRTSKNFQKQIPLFPMKEYRANIKEYMNMASSKRWQWGTLNEEMINKGWKTKINAEYSSQGVVVETGSGFIDGNYHSELHAVLLFVNLDDLLRGKRMLPSCFGGGHPFLTDVVDGNYFIRQPTWEIALPRKKRVEWLKEYFSLFLRTKYLGLYGDLQTLAEDFFTKKSYLPGSGKITIKQLFRWFLEALKCRGGWACGKKDEELETLEEIVNQY